MIRPASLIRLLAFGVLLALAVPAVASASDDALRSVESWFSVDDRTLDHWQTFSPDAADDQRILLRRRAAVTRPLQRVMVIYPRKSTAYDVAMSTMLHDFADRPLNIEILAVNFAVNPQRGALLIAEARREGYALIYAMGSETAEWLYQDHRDIDIPVVTVCAKDPVQLGQMPDYERGSGNSFAFTSLNVLLDVQIGYLRELKPQLRNVVILVDDRNTSAVATQARPIAEALQRQGIQASEVAVTEPAQAKEQLAALVPAAVAQMRRTDPGLEQSVFWVTGSTSVFAEIATINAYSGTVPVLAVVPEVVQAGRDSAVLSIGVSFESNAQLAALYGADILAGKSWPASMKVGVVSPPDIAINFLRAREIGLKIPFSFFEAATFIFDASGKPVRIRGQTVFERRGG
jgi:putative ABC transport system substrate-binding protein